MINVLKSIYQLWNDFVALIFPEVCLNCSEVLLKNETQLCTSCLFKLPVSNDYLSVNDNPVYNDLKIIENLVGAVSYLKYNRHGMAQTLLKSLKYKQNDEIGLLLGKWFGSHLSSVISADIMIPVPIHPSKLKTRGYNQSFVIAKGIQNHLSISIDDEAVIRSKRTSTQTKKDKITRWQSMTDVFHVVKPECIRDKRLVIVDDVVTTGATIHSLCDALNKYQPKSIQVLAIASGK